MKGKARKVAGSMPEGTRPVDWLGNESSDPAKPYSAEQLEELAAGVERGIRDTPVWKDWVRCVGLKEARRILQAGILSAQDIPGYRKNRTSFTYYPRDFALPAPASA